MIHVLGRTRRTLEETKATVEQNHPKTKVIVHVVDIIDLPGVKQTAETIGSWDVLIANAGYISVPTRIEDGDPDEWWKAFEINIKGNYILARAFLPHKKSGGTIVAYSSGLAFLPPGLEFLSKNSSYSVSKMGNARFYEFLAVENPDLNVFILHPGLIRTALYEKGEFQLDSTLDTVQLPAHFSVWLASPEARPLSGRFLFANWDVEQLKTIVPRLEADPVYLTTSLGGFPFSG